MQKPTRKDYSKVVSIAISATHSVKTAIGVPAFANDHYPGLLGLWDSDGSDLSEAICFAKDSLVERFLKNIVPSQQPQISKPQEKRKNRVIIFLKASKKTDWSSETKTKKGRTAEPAFFWLPASENKTSASPDWMMKNSLPDGSAWF